MNFLKKIMYLALGGISIAACGSLLMFIGDWAASGPSWTACTGGRLTIMPFFYAGELYPPFFHILDYLSKLPPPSGSVIVYFVLPAIAWTAVLSVFYALYGVIRNQFRRLKVAENKTGE